MNQVVVVDPPVRLALGEGSRARAVVSGRCCGDVSLRIAGAAAVEARARVLDHLGLDVDRAVFAEQVHGAGVAVVGADQAARGSRDERGAITQTDALVTTATGIALCVQVADCVPVALAVADSSPGVAAVHAGRGGVAAGVVGAAVAALAEQADVAPTRIVAAIGPAVGGCCYEVPAEIAVEIAAIVPAARTTTRWGTPGLDLPAAVEAQARAAGARTVTRLDACTRCHPARWFSHRAWQAGEATPGRQMLAVAAAEPEPLDPARSLNLRA